MKHGRNSTTTFVANLAVATLTHIHLLYFLAHTGIREISSLKIRARDRPLGGLRNLDSDAKGLDQDLEHVSQPAALAAWLGAMLSPYRANSPGSTFAFFPAPRLIPTRLHIYTTAQER
jgi:hypothetical protein